MADAPPPSPEMLVSDLVDLLTVEAASDMRFVGGAQVGGVGRVFGGQVVAQALQSAQATAPEGLEAHSLHAYFLRAGKEGVATHFSVDADFEGRSFANRRVVASQAEDDPDDRRAILNCTISFQRPEAGLEHQQAELPKVVAPEELRSDMEMRHAMIEKMGDRLSAQQRAFILRPRPIEMRTMDRLHWMNDAPREARAHSWFRTVAPLPDIEDTHALHRAIIAYASDYTLLGTSALPHGLSWMRGELVGASLDHAIWFHRPARADDWLLYATESPWSGSGRGLNRGQIFDRDGNLVASVAQEGMMRRRIAKE